MQNTIFERSFLYLEQKLLHPKSLTKQFSKKSDQNSLLLRHILSEQKEQSWQNMTL